MRFSVVASSIHVQWTRANCGLKTFNAKNICEIIYFAMADVNVFLFFVVVAFCWAHRDEFCILRRFYATCVYICSRKWRFLDPRFYFSGTDIVTQMQGTCLHDTVESHVFPLCTYASVLPVPGVLFLLRLHRSSQVVARSTSGGADESTRHVLFLVMDSQLPVCRWLQRLSLRRLFSVASAAVNV